MSPIRELAGPFSVGPFVAAAGTTMPLMHRDIHREPVGPKTTQKLELSGVILTMDIPPLTPEQMHEVAIIQLAEMLQRW